MDFRPDLGGLVAFPYTARLARLGRALMQSQQDIRQATQANGGKLGKRPFRPPGVAFQSPLLG